MAFTNNEWDTKQRKTGTKMRIFNENYSMQNKLGRKDIILPELSYQIVGSCFDAFHQVGGGKNESVYQRSVAIQFAKRGIPFKEQVSVPIECDGIRVGTDIADFLVAGSIVLELKAGSRFRRQDYYQVLRNIQTTCVPLGILARFTNDGVVTSRVLSPGNLS